jgi:hypothetical protein
MRWGFNMILIGGSRWGWIGRQGEFRVSMKWRKGMIIPTLRYIIAGTPRYGIRGILKYMIRGIPKCKIIGIPKCKIIGTPRSALIGMCFPTFSIKTHLPKETAYQEQTKKTSSSPIVMSQKKIHPDTKPTNLQSNYQRNKSKTFRVDLQP